MDRRTTGVILGALLMGACTCGESFDLPEAPPTEPAPPVASGDPRVPSGFDLTWPEDATVRYGEASLERATVLVTTEAEPAAVLRFAREQLEGRGWSVRARAGEAPAGVGVFREAIEAFEGDEPRASAIVERGAAPVTRLHLSRSSSRAVAFHAPDEPREWRAVRRAPLPAPPGPTEPACNQALMRMCEALQAAGGPDALDCALDRRAACVRIELPEPALRFAEDSRARLAEALTAHAIVGSRGARRETAAQLRVELLAARASLVRAAAAGAQAPELAALIAATEAGPVRVEVDTASWFAREPDEIPEGESP